MGDGRDGHDPRPRDDALKSDLGRTAYEARFAHCRFADPARGLNGDVLPWSHLPPEARAIWARVEHAVLAQSRSQADPGDPFKRQDAP